MKIKKMNPWKGRCHCGAIRFVFETYLPVDDLPLRSCSCSFCVKRGTRCTSDPNGSVQFKVKSGHLSNYDSNLIIKRVICKNCGVYLGTLLLTDSRTYATLNVNTFEHQKIFHQSSTPIDYSNLTLRQRKERWKTLWTPASILYSGST